MKPLPTIALCAVLSTALTPPAWPQCPTWIPGAFDNGTAVNGTNGDVYVSTLWDPDGAGPLPPALVIGGSFTSVQGVPATNIAMRDPVTGQWRALGAGVNSPVFAMTTWNGNLVIGCSGDNDSTTYDNTIRQWDGASWTGFNGGTNIGGIGALAVWNGDLYAGGKFKISSAGAFGIAKWNSGSGQWVAVPGLTSNITQIVTSLTVWDNVLVAGMSGNNDTAGFVWYYNGSSWTFVADTDGPIYALQPFNGELAVGGNFQVVNGGEFAFPSVFEWAGGSIIQSYAPGGMNGTVRSLTVYNGQLYVGGNFTAVGPSYGTPAGHACVLSAATWQSFGGGALDGEVFTMVPFGSDLVFGGRFTTAVGFPANNLARWSGEEVDWTPFGGGDASLVACMTQYAGRLVLGGIFHQSDDPRESAYEIAGWDGTSLYSFGTGMDGPVSALKSYAFGPISHRTLELVAGGSFLHAGGAAANNIAVWDQSALIATNPAWQPMGAGFDGPVQAIERATVNGATNTYAGGFFSTGPDIALWNGSSWASVGGGLNGTVYALRAFGGDLYAGGNFTASAGSLVPTGSFAVWNGVTWYPAGGVSGTQFPGTVRALEVYNGKLVIGGSFSGIGGGPNLEQWDGTSYSDIAPGGADGEVDAIHVLGSRLYVGGSFTHVGGVVAQHLAYYDGSWHGVPGGADNTVFALSDFGGELQVGGAMLTVGSPTVTVPRWARENFAGNAWFVTQPFSQTADLGTNVSFTAAVASGYGSSGEQWYRFGAPLSDGPTGTGSTISGSTTATLGLTNISHEDYGEYQAIVTTLCGPDSSVVVSLTPGGGTGVGDGRVLVSRFESIAPNPSHGPSTISFALERASEVELRVHDIAGRQIGRFALGRVGTGHHQLGWIARGDDGRAVGPGVYFVTLLADGRRIGSRRLALVR